MEERENIKLPCFLFPKSALLALVNLDNCSELKGPFVEPIFSGLARGRPLIEALPAFALTVLLAKGILENPLDSVGHLALGAGDVYRLGISLDLLPRAEAGRAASFREEQHLFNVAGLLLLSANRTSIHPDYRLKIRHLLILPHDPSRQPVMAYRQRI